MLNTPSLPSQCAHCVGFEFWSGAREPEPLHVQYNVTAWIVAVRALCECGNSALEMLRKMERDKSKERAAIEYSVYNLVVFSAGCVADAGKAILLPYKAYCSHVNPLQKYRSTSYKKMVLCHTCEYHYQRELFFSAGKPDDGFGVGY